MLFFENVVFIMVQRPSGQWPETTKKADLSQKPKPKSQTFAIKWVIFQSTILESILGIVILLMKLKLSTAP